MSKIKKVYKARGVMEGAGVPVNRVFGNAQVPDFDPFLMLDYFEFDPGVKPAGFPWHPHKGIETITYMLKGSVEHEDSLGHKGIIGPTDLQWMTAAKGILHQEMPASSPDGGQGFQFWLNMPAAEKLGQPKYQDFKGEELKHIYKGSTEVRLISGKFEGEVGPINQSKLGVTMMHVLMKENEVVSIKREKDKNSFIFVFTGDGYIEKERIESKTAYTLNEGAIVIKSDKNSPLEFIYAQGKPIREPVAWYGPIVMNTKEELNEAFDALENGTFIKE
jgi:quercetin 2,3-dioxygenase